MVDRHSDTEVLEGYAEAQLDAIKSAIDRLPAKHQTNMSRIFFCDRTVREGRDAGGRFLAGRGQRRRGFAAGS